MNITQIKSFYKSGQKSFFPLRPPISEKRFACHERDPPPFFPHRGSWFLKSDAVPIHYVSCSSLPVDSGIVTSGGGEISVPQLAAVGIQFPVCRRVEGFRIHAGAFLRRHAGTARHKTPGNKQQKQKKTNHGVKPSFPVFSPGKPSPDFFFLKQQSVVKHSEI